MPLHISGYLFLTVILSPFVQAAPSIMDIAFKKIPVIRIIKYLPNGRASALRYHSIDEAFALRHPGPWKSHLCLTLAEHEKKTAGSGLILLVFDGIDRLG